MKEARSHRARVWDLPTRLFHWCLALLVVAAFVTINVGGNWVQWHFRCGYAILALLLFRLIWGVVGGRHSRFASFVVGPRAVLSYLREPADVPHAPGHNPLGALSVLAILSALTIQIVLGLFANDDIASEGPLAVLVSKETSDLLTSAHHAWKVAVIALIALHVSAIVFYRVARKRNLVAPMIAGDADSPVPFEPSRDDAGRRLLALVVLAACALAVWLIVGGALTG
ncbi:MAG: cytochrome b/b6 domain-containing protein [Burkholderiaceae bacterium]